MRVSGVTVGQNALPMQSGMTNPGYKRVSADCDKVNFTSGRMARALAPQAKAVSNIVSDFFSGVGRTIGIAAMALLVPIMAFAQTPANVAMANGIRAIDKINEGAEQIQEGQKQQVAGVLNVQEGQKQQAAGVLNEVKADNRINTGQQQQIEGASQANKGQQQQIEGTLKVQEAQRGIKKTTKEAKQRLDDLEKLWQDEIKNGASKSDVKKPVIAKL